MRAHHRTGRFYGVEVLLITLLRAAACILFLTAPHVTAQSVTFEREGVEYRLELPSARWRVVTRPDVHDHFDFVYGLGGADGYVRVRKSVVDAGKTPKDLYRREVAMTLKFLPAYVGCSSCEGETFAGGLKGAVFSYEYASEGRLMAGRIYYLQVDARTFYSLHLTCGRNRLAEVGPQADSIAASFRLK